MAGFYALVYGNCRRNLFFFAVPFEPNTKAPDVVDSLFGGNMFDYRSGVCFRLSAESVASVEYMGLFQIEIPYFGTD